MAQIVETKTDPESKREYYVYDNGGEQWKDNGYWKKPFMSITTTERSRELLSRRREKALVSHLRGLAKGAGIELAPDANLEEVVHGAVNGLEALTSHLAKTFLKSDNLRGMGETYGKLTTPLLGAPEAMDLNSRLGDATRLFLVIAELTAREKSIDAEVIDSE